MTKFTSAKFQTILRLRRMKIKNRFLILNQNIVNIMKESVLVESVCQNSEVNFHAAKFVSVISFMTISVKQVKVIPAGT